MANEAGLMFKKELSSIESQIKAVLPPHITVDRFQRIVLVAVQDKPDLLLCDRQSLLRSCLKCAQDGLLPDGREAALVPFKPKNSDVKIVQYLPMYQGVLKKVRNSGEIKDIRCHVVYSNDVFKYSLGDVESIIHEPVLENRGKPICAYMIANLASGEVHREVMTVQDIEKARSVSRMSSSGPWVDWWDEQARKTVLKRGAKWLPSSTDRDGRDNLEIVRRDDEEEGTILATVNHTVTSPIPSDPRASQNAAAKQLDNQTRESVPQQTAQQQTATVPVQTQQPATEKQRPRQTRTDEVTEKLVAEAKAKREAETKAVADAQKATEEQKTLNVDPNSGEILNALDGWPTESESAEDGAQFVPFDTTNQPAQAAAPAQQTQPAQPQQAEQPKKRKGGFVREGMTGSFTKVDENLQPVAQVPQQTQTPTPAATQAAPQQAAAIKAAPKAASTPTPAAKPAPATLPAPLPTRQEVVLFAGGSLERNMNKETIRVRLVDHHNQVYYLKPEQEDIATDLKNNYLKPQVPALVTSYEAETRLWIVKIEPVPTTAPLE